MLKVVIKILCNLIFSILEVYMTKLLTNTKRKAINLKDIIAIILLTILNTIMYKVDYNVEITVIRTLISMLILKYIIQEPLGKILISYLGCLFITIIADLLNYSIMTQILTIEQLRDSWYGMLICNINVAMTILIIFQIRPIRNEVIKFIEKLNKNNIVKPLIFFILTFIAIINLLFNITKNQYNNEIFILDLLIIVTFLILVTILMLDNEKYNQLLNSYDILFKYTKDFEDTIDEIDLNNHEYKNQLAILKTHIKNDNKTKALKILKEISNESLTIDGKYLVELKNIPKGGIKGLLYYKIMIAEQKNLKVYIEVSKTSTKLLEQINEEQIKVLCRLIGVYLDNAIEASELTEEKIISIEIYTIDDKINLVFANSIANMTINLDDMNKKGISTKGKKRGKGLYLVNKLIARNKWLKCKNKIINQFYTQHIEVNIKNS